MVSYLVQMMTSWAIVVDVWYLPPMTKREVRRDAQSYEPSPRFEKLLNITAAEC